MAMAPQGQETMDVRKKHGSFESVSEFSRVFGADLKQGDALIMPPGQIHAVVTQTDACAVGMHFQLAETLGDTVVFGKADATTQKGFVNDGRSVRPLLTRFIGVKSS